eukprot:5823208-Pyramimonas_sp.AAC.1
MAPENAPKWIATHPEFQRFLEAAIAETPTELGPWQRLEQLKELMFASAAHVREFVKREIADSPFSFGMRLNGFIPPWP